MKVLTLIFLVFINFNIAGQTFQLSGTINNFASDYMYLFKCQSDTVIFLDSIATDASGKFLYNKNANQGLYKMLVEDKYFFILNDNKPIELKTTYKYDYFENFVIANLAFITSDENKRFLQFQKAQLELNIAIEFFLPLLQVYPISDPYYPQIEKEYINRNKKMDSFIFENSNKSSLSYKIAAAYYQPVYPDWRITPDERIKITKRDFFKFYNPSDEFYFNTNIIPEKINNWLSLNLPSQENQKVDETLLGYAAIEYLEKAKPNEKVFNFSLLLILKKLSDARFFNSFLIVYDKFLFSDNNECEQKVEEFLWARNLASTLREISVGKVAPNFNINKNFALNDVQSDYTIIVFWATWCGHCMQTLPEFKKSIDDIKKKYLGQSTINIIAISLDKDSLEWQKYIQNNGLSSWLHTSELKGWNGEISKKFNIYATPTFILLNKKKEILSYFGEVKEINEYFISKYIDKKL